MMRTVPFLFFIIICVVFLGIAFGISEPGMRVVLASRDFRNHYTGALLIRNGARSDFYDAGVQYRTQKSFIPELDNQVKLMPFNRPPPVAALLSPLARVPFTTAYRIFTAFNIFLLGGIVFAAVRVFTLRMESKKRTIVSPLTPYIFIIFACYLPVWVTLLQGQFSYFLFLIFFAMWYFSLKNDEPKTGLAVSGLAVFPQLLIVPLLFFLFMKKYKTLLWSAAGLGIFLALSVLIIGFEGVMKYPRFLNFLSGAGETYTMHPRDEPTLRSLIHIIFGTDFVTPVMTGVWIAGSALLFYAVIRAYKSSNYTLGFAAMIAVTEVTSAHTNYHDLMLLLLAAFLILRAYIDALPSALLKKIASGKHLLLLVFSSGALAASGLAYLFPVSVPLALAAGYLLHRNFPSK
jgi:hypothetical protein